MGRQERLHQNCTTIWNNPRKASRRNYKVKMEEAGESNPEKDNDNKCFAVIYNDLITAFLSCPFLARMSLNLTSYH